MSQKVPKEAKAKRDGVINPQNEYMNIMGFKGIGFSVL